MTTDNRKERTKLAIQNAMIKLLKTKHFDQISTILIAQTAGISRSSFYTHYKDKYEIIDNYQQLTMVKIEYIFQKYNNHREETFIEFFEFLKNEELLSMLISLNGSNGSHSYIINKIKSLIIPKLNHLNLTKTERDYTTIYLAHAFFGICQTWVLYHFKETPQEMTKIVLRMLPHD